MSAHNTTDALQFIAAAHPDNRDSKYWAAHSIYIDLTKVAQRQQAVVVSQMIGSGLNQEDALARTYTSPSDCTSSDSLPTGNVSELSSGSAGIPSLGRGDGKLVSCYISQQCNTSTNEDQGDMSTTIQTAQILSLERTHMNTMLLKAWCEVSLLKKEKELADVRLSAACAECDISNNDPRLTALVPV